MEHFRLAELCVTLLRARRDPVVIAGAEGCGRTAMRRKKVSAPPSGATTGAHVPGSFPSSPLSDLLRGERRPGLLRVTFPIMTASARRRGRDSPASSGSVDWPSATSSGPLEGGLVRRVPSNFPGVTQSRSAAHWTGADQPAPPLRRSRPVSGSPDAWPRSRRLAVSASGHDLALAWTARQEALKKHMRILEKSRCANNSIWSWTPYCARATSTSTSKPTTRLCDDVQRSNGTGPGAAMSTSMGAGRPGSPTSQVYARFRSTRHAATSSTVVRPWWRRRSRWPRWLGCRRCRAPCRRRHGLLWWQPLWSCRWRRGDGRSRRRLPWPRPLGGVSGGVDEVDGRVG